MRCPLNDFEANSTAHSLHCFSLPSSDDCRSNGWISCSPSTSSMLGAEWCHLLSTQCSQCKRHSKVKWFFKRRGPLLQHCRWPSLQTFRCQTNVKVDWRKPQTKSDDESNTSTVHSCGASLHRLVTEKTERTNQCTEISLESNDHSVEMERKHKGNGRKFPLKIVSFSSCLTKRKLKFEVD